MLIIGLMMCKDEVDIIKRTLDENSKFVDGFVILDNGSTDGTLEIIKKHPSVLEVIEDNGEFDERRLLKIMFQFADKYKADWYLEVDADEIVCQLINGIKFMNLDKYNCISFNIYYMLEEMCYKIYKHWGRFYRNIGLEKMLDGCDKAVYKLHWGKNPIPKDERKYFHSEVVMYHYQMRSYEQVVRKYNRYIEIDKDAIQGKGYEQFKFFAHALKTRDYTGINFIDI
jgi:glycosyltransferase involved in cell wall biosynthesis